MFNITLSPARGDTPITLEKRGEALIVNGEVFDFSFLSDGDTLPQDAVLGDWLGSDVTCVGGNLTFVLNMPYGQNAPEETRFPKPVTVKQDGLITLPPYETMEDDGI